MNLSLAFLHGEQALIGLVLAGLIALIGIPLLLYLWLWHTKVSELKLAIAYLVLVAILCVVFTRTRFPLSMLSLTPFALAFILTLPWSAVAIWALEGRDAAINDHEFAVTMVLGAGINAVLLYLAAVKMRRLIK